MIILAQGTLVIFGLFLLILGGICFLGTLSFILSFTSAKQRGTDSSMRNSIICSWIRLHSDTGRPTIR